MESKKYKPDVVLGLGRNGGVVGGILASFLDSMPLMLLDTEYSKKKSKLHVEFRSDCLVLPKSVKTVLVIEGTTTGGTTLP